MSGRVWARRAAALRAAPAVAALCLALHALAAGAHHVTPDEVIRSLTQTGARSTFDITSAERAADLPRLLLIRVGPGWSRVYATRRIIAAEQWYELWRDAVPSGIVAIVDAADQPLVNFEPTGRATLREGPATTPRP